MAFTDPISVTLDSTPISLPRVSSDGRSSLYSNADESLKMRISHQETKQRTRRMVRLDQRIIAENSFTALNEYKTLSCYLVIDEPEIGFNDDQIGDLVLALSTFLTANAMACTMKVAGGQH